MLERKKKRNSLPAVRALLCSSAFLLIATTSAHANTLGTLSIPSTNASPDTETGVNAAILNSSQNELDVVANRTVTLGRDDTLAHLLVREGIAKAQREAALRALEDFIDVAEIPAGSRIELSVRGAEPAKRQLVALHLRTGSSGDLTVVAGEDGAFRPLDKSKTPAKSWSVGVTTRNGSVTHGLKADLAAARVPEKVADDVIAAFSYDPDIPAKPSKGSTFTVVYETASAGATPLGSGLQPAQGQATHVLRYAELSIYGQDHRVYRYETQSGAVAFMEESGRGFMPLELGAPVRDAKMTSPWGWRIHPVLKTRKFHKGVDFAAPKGTPVYAAEDGVVEVAGWRGNYGRYMRVKHNERVDTAYAHLSKFAAGLHAGSTVRKGQVIAYIGASGLATGNHLYYEVLVDRKQVDPLRNVMVRVDLDGTSLASFQTYVSELSQAAQP